MLAPHTGKEQALVVADTLKRAVAGATFLGKGGDRVAVTFSAGISSFPDDGESVEELLRKADEAMYRSKAAGKNRAVAAAAERIVKRSRRPARRAAKNRRGRATR